MNIVITSVIIVVYLVLLFGVCAFAQKRQKRMEAAFPDPVYPEWVLAIITFFICFFADKRTVEIPAGDQEAIAAR